MSDIVQIKIIPEEKNSFAGGTITGSSTQLIDNFDNFTYTSDFFSPIDKFSFQLKGESIKQLNKIAYNCKIEISIKGNVLLTGYIDNYQYSSSRGGTICTITGRNDLGYVADSTNFPDIQNNFQINQSLQQIFNTIFKPFGFTVISSNGEISNTTKLNKKLLAQAKSKQVGHRCEGVLEMAIRFARRYGWFIRQIDKDIVGLITPSYGKSLFTIVNYKDLSLNLDTQSQPSILIGNSKTNAGFGYNVTNTTIAVVNEITGLANNNQQASNVTLENNKYYGSVNANVEAYIKDHKLEKASKIKGNKVEVNELFLKSLNQLNKYANTNVVCRPYYYYDENSIDVKQTEIATKMKLNEFQRKFFTVNITVEGLTNNNLIWQPNNMCKLDLPSNLLDLPSNLWIQSINMSYSRAAGATTQLKLGLPGIYTEYS